MLYNTGGWFAPVGCYSEQGTFTYEHGTRIFFQYRLWAVAASGLSDGNRFVWEAGLRFTFTYAVEESFRCMARAQ